MKPAQVDRADGGDAVRREARVLVYAPFSFTGQGPAESCASIVAGFPELGLQTDVFAARFRRRIRGPVHHHPSLPVLTRYLPWRVVSDQALSQLDKDFARALRSADPERTIAYFWPDPPIELVRLATSLGIVTVREMINTACATSGPILDKAYSRLPSPASHSVSADRIRHETEELHAHDFFFASNPEVEGSLQTLGIASRQILSTTFGWTPERFVLQRPVVPHDGVRLLFVGTLSARKGVPELLKAWSAAEVEGELVLAGGVSSEVADLVADHSPSDRVRTLGYVKDVAALFNSADVFVFPTLEEGGPQVTYEAAGCGLPVITTPMGAARLVETGVSGIVIDPGSVSQLTEAILRLSTDDELRRVCGEEARRRAAAFTYRTVAAQRAALLLDVFASRSRD